MDITNSERLHTKDNGPLQTEVSTSAYKTHSYLQAKIGHKANQNRTAKPTAGPLLAVQDCSEKSLLVVFLPQRITAGCNQGGWQREITVGSVVQRGMRAAVEGIREVGSAEQNLHRRNDEFST
ncbi:hypothetical protein B296_00017779 [Ensete ventricosum]|uniref:Uncharacterized protein n=1 Tax=Ensete ventricosum TaxID=4639 RepID=A0A426ZGN9_ENSVE|nr:hypothetical protein B296_00017779 [Ensete ventricosum]